MTREQIEKEIEKLENEIFIEEMKDRGYDYRYVNERRERIRELEKELHK